MRGGYRSLEERVRLYNKALELRRRFGYGYKRIARILSLPPSTVQNWIIRGQNPLRRCNEVVIGAELAYVVGAWLGDGTLLRGDDGNYVIRLRCKDYEFAKEWGRCLAKALGRPTPYIPRWDNSRGMWEVKGSSTILYSILLSAREDPHRLTPLLEKYPRHACRGFFDAEGSVHIKVPLVEASNTNNDIIDLFAKLLKQIGIDCHKWQCRMGETFIDPRSGKPSHRNSKFLIYLGICGRKNIIKFYEEVNFTIKRKRRKLREWVKRYRKM